MANKELQVEAIERNVPKIFEVENRLTVDSNDLPEVKKWKIGGKYKVEVEVTQLAAREMTDGAIEGEFEVTDIKDIT